MYCETFSTSLSFIRWFLVRLAWMRLISIWRNREMKSFARVWTLASLASLFNARRIIFVNVRGVGAAGTSVSAGFGLSGVRGSRTLVLSEVVVSAALALLLALVLLLVEGW